MKLILLFTFTLFLFANFVIASTNKVTIAKTVEKAKQSTNETPVKTVVPKPKRVPTRQLVKQLDSVSNSIAMIAIIDQIGNQDNGSKYVLESFSVLLTHKDEDVRQAVLNAACAFDSTKKLLPALVNALNDSAESIREDSADILSDIETRDMIAAFVCNLTNQYEDVRDNCEFYLLFHTDETFETTPEWVSWWASNKTSFVFE